MGLGSLVRVVTHMPHMYDGLGLILHIHIHKEVGFRSER